MKTKNVFHLSALCVALAATVAANAAPVYDANVTNNVITGTGITNGGFTVDTGSGVEIGLRARERYTNPVAGIYAPSNDTNSNGDGSYNHAAGGFTPIPFSANGTAGGTRAAWVFDWSINTGTANVGAYGYALDIDFDAGVGTNFLTFDLINWPLADHSFGNNGTAQGAGVEAVSAAGYTALLGSSNLVQNSWNMDFFDGALFPFDPNANGQYTIRLAALDANGQALARSTIDVIVGTGATVPEPTSLALIGLALAGLAVTRRRA